MLSKSQNGFKTSIRRCGLRFQTYMKIRPLNEQPNGSSNNYLTSTDLWPTLYANSIELLKDPVVTDKGASFNLGLRFLGATSVVDIIFVHGNDYSIEREQDFVYWFEQLTGILYAP